MGQQCGSEEFESLDESIRSSSSLADGSDLVARGSNWLRDVIVMRAAKWAENVVRSWRLADVDEEKIDNLEENVTA